jgi:hypothetical protein
MVFKLYLDYLEYEINNNNNNNNNKIGLNKVKKNAIYVYWCLVPVSQLICTPWLFLSIPWDSGLAMLFLKDFFCEYLIFFNLKIYFLP